MAGPSNPSAASSLDPLAGLLDDPWLTEQTRQQAPAAGPRSTANAPRLAPGSGRTQREIPRSAPVQQTKPPRDHRARTAAGRTTCRVAIAASAACVLAAAGTIASTQLQPAAAPATAELSASARTDVGGALTRAGDRLASAERQRARAAERRQQRAAARERAARRAQQRAAARKRARAQLRTAAPRAATPAPPAAQAAAPRADSAPARASAPRPSRTPSNDPSSCELGPC